MRPTPFSSRCNPRFTSRCDLRPSPALFSQPPREINTQQPRHTLHSARTTPKRTHHHARAAAIERGQDDLPRDQLHHQPLRARDTNPPPAGVTTGPASSHACSARSFRSALPLRARPGHMLQVHTRTCTVRSRAASPVLLTACALFPGAGSRSCEWSGTTATAPSTSTPRPAGATSTPRS